MTRVIEYMLAPLRRQVRLMVGRAVVKMVNDGGGLQTLQVEALAGELRTDVPRYQNYGFTSVPRPGAVAVGVSPGGRRESFVVITVDDPRGRLMDLAEGDVAVYHDSGARLVFRDGGQVELSAPGGVSVYTPLMDVKGELRCDGPLLCQGDIQANGQVSDGGGSMQYMRGRYNIHIHEEGGNPPAPPMA